MTIETRRQASALDNLDELAPLRAAFDLPEGVIYLDGNSLGALPFATGERVSNVVSAEWGRDLVKSWNSAGWMNLPKTVGARIAALIGADADEVVATDSTSVNLFKVVAAAARMRSGRHKIISEPGNFPTDLYMLEGLTSLLPNLELIILPRGEIAGAIDDNTAAIVLTHVHYVTAEMFDMKAMTKAAHAVGALAIWDLSHSAGAVEVNLGDAKADFAVGCGYKYLNGGPGAPAFVYVAKRHHGVAVQPLSGWHGHKRPFDFIDAYEAASGVDQFLCGTPGIIGMAALDESLKIFDRTSMKALRAKSVALCKLFIELVERDCAGYGLSLVGLRDMDVRGSHVSFRHSHGYEVMKALIHAGVIGDFRAPDHIRFGFTPLYVGFADVWDAVQCLKGILQEETYKDPEFAVRDAVT